MRKINWICPYCGHNKIVLVTKRATVYTPIIGIYDTQDEPVFDYGKDEFDVEGDGAAFYSYECGICGHVIAEGRDEDFIKVIKHLIQPQEYPPNAQVVCVKGK